MTILKPPFVYLDCRTSPCMVNVTFSIKSECRVHVVMGRNAGGRKEHHVAEKMMELWCQITFVHGAAHQKRFMCHRPPFLKFLTSLNATKNLILSVVHCP